jgi:hypothetical protein
MLGAIVSVNAGQNLNVTNTVTVNSGAYLTVAGGFSAGNLVNDGDLVVINAAIDGPVVNNNKTTVVGTVNFNGPVSGPGGFFGPGTAQFNGGMAPGASPALVAFEGNIVFGNANTLAIELGGATPGSQHDQIQASGTVTVGGTLQVSLIDGFSAVAGQAFDILDWGSLAGTFDAINLPMLSGLAWNTSELYTSGVLSVGLAGDYNNNGVVDAADYTVWRKGLGTTYMQADYDVWRAHFGETAGSGAGSTANVPVPEPATMLLFLAGALISLIRRGIK